MNELTELRAAFFRYARTLPSRSFIYAPFVLVAYIGAPEQKGFELAAFGLFLLVYFPPEDFWVALRSYLRRNEKDS